MLNLLRDGRGEKEGRGVEAEVTVGVMFEVGVGEMLVAMAGMEELGEVEVVEVHLEVCEVVEVGLGIALDELEVGDKGGGR